MNATDRVVRATLSPCPQCKRILPATVLLRDERLYLHRICPEHGEREDLFRQDYDFFMTIDGILDKTNEQDPRLTFFDTYDHIEKCRDLYIDLTERCNLRCPVCYTNSNSRDVEDLSYEEITSNLERLGGRRPIISLLGGEPTLREDLPELIRFITQRGFLVKLITNGIRLRDEAYLETLKQSGLKWVILQFDGFSDEIYRKTRGRELAALKMEVIEKLARRGFVIVLASMIIKGINDHEVGRIIEFARDHPRIVQIGFLPTTNIGRSTVPEDMSDLEASAFMDMIEVQTAGRLTKQDFIDSARMGHLYCRITGNLAYKARTCVYGLFIYHDEQEMFSITRIADPRFLAGKLRRMPRIASALATIAHWNADPVNPNLFGIVIEKFRNQNAFDFQDAKNCTKVYMTRHGYIPNCMYNAIYRPQCR